MQQQHNPFKIYSHYVIPLIEISAMTSQVKANPLVVAHKAFNLVPLHLS